MAVEGRARKTGSSVAQGIEDLAQSWAHLAREMAPEVPELPAVLQQEVVSLNVGEITEDRLNQVAHAIVQRVSDAGFSEQAAALQRRMGRAMYELLLLIATEEELRTMGMLLEASAPPGPATPPSPAAPPPRPAAVPTAAAPPLPAVAPAPPAPAPNSDRVGGGQAASGQPPVTAPSTDPHPLTAGPESAAPPAPVAVPPLAAPPAPARAATPSGASPLSAPSANPQPRTTGPASAAPPLPVAVPPLTPPPAPARAAIPSGASPTSSAPVAAGRPGPAAAPTQGAVPVAEASPQLAAPMFTRVEAPSVTAPPAAPAAAEVADAEAGLWGFDPAERESPPGVAAGSAPPAVDPVAVVAEAALAVESRPAGSASGSSTADTSPASPHGWTVRLSPRAARERESRLRKRLDELPVLTDAIIAQVHQQRRAVSDRGTAREAVHAASEQSAPSELAVAATRMAELIDGHRLTEAAALALRASEAFPGEVAADLACRVGEAARHSKDDDLATLCFTTSVLAAPPGDPACWQLAGMALERKDPRLAPIWMEFLAKLLRARGADEDAVVVYRQLLSLTPRREDVRDILRLASLTGVLPD